MMGKKYVSDESYKKGQRLLKKIRIILLIVASILIVGGITLIVLGKTKRGSISAGDYEWVENYGNANAMIFAGIVMTIFSLVCFVYCIYVTVIMHKREIIAFNASATVPVAKEVISEVAPVVGDAIGEIVKGTRKGINDGKTEAQGKKDVVCPKCSYKNDKTDKFCGGCGEKLDQKKHCSCGTEIKFEDKFCSKCGTKAE